MFERLRGMLLPAERLGGSRRPEADVLSPRSEAPQTVPEFDYGMPSVWLRRRGRANQRGRKPIMLTSLAFALLLLAFGTTAEARFDSYQTATGARVTAVFPEVVNEGDEFFVSVSADGGPNGGTVNSFPTAPTGWTFIGCTFVSVDVNQVGTTQKAQAVRLNMTDDTCSWYVEILWANNLGQQNGATTIQGTSVTDEQDQNVFAQDWAEPFIWFLWALLAVGVHFIPEMYARIAVAAVGFVVLAIPVPESQKNWLIVAQCLLMMVIIIEWIFSEREKAGTSKRRKVRYG